MNQDAISRQRLAEVGAYICAHTDEIVALWERHSRNEHADAADEQRDALRDHLPTFLRRYGENLVHDEGHVPRSHALDHGMQRWRIGWDVESLVRDFMILRRVLVAKLRIDVGLTVGEAMQIASSIDEAVALSVNAYVKHREEELNRKNALLRRSNHELKRFAHIIAHEIRNPLTTAQMAVARLQRYVRSSDDERVPGAIDTINEELVSITEVIRNLLEYADVESARSDPRDQVDLNDVLEEVKSSLHHTIDESHALVTSDDLPIVCGRRRALVQLLQNLVENSIKYHGDDPPRIHISSQRRDNALLLAVQDNGIGIPERDRALVFRFLKRAHTDRDVPGTGIGLAICKRVAEQHGGDIWIESTSEQGTTFHVTLCDQPEVVTSEAARGQTAAGSARPNDA